MFLQLALVVECPPAQSHSQEPSTPMTGEYLPPWLGMSCPTPTCCTAPLGHVVPSAITTVNVAGLMFPLVVCPPQPMATCS